MRKWWLLRHVADPDGEWIPVKLWTIFGVPLCFYTFQAWGPWRTEAAAEQAAETGPITRQGAKNGQG